jgi:signal transduction histidine kinase
MRYLLALFCCLAIPLLIYSQPVAPNFSRQIAAAKSDTAKANIYRKAIVYYYRRNADSMKFYADQGLDFFRERKSEMGEAMVIAQLAMHDRVEGRMNIALQRFRFALEIYRKENYLPGIADLLGNIGSLEASKGNYDVAAKYITESLKMEEKFNRPHGVMVGLMNLASIYFQQNDTTKADEYLKQAIVVSKRLPISAQVIELYNLQGVLFAIKGRNDEALACFLHNLEQSGGAAFVGPRVECLSYLGQYYLDNGSPEKAMVCLNDGLKLAAANNLPEMRASILLTLAALVQDKEPDKAIEYLDEGLEIAKEMDDKSYMAMIYNEEAAYYKVQGKYKEALFALEQKQKIRDSIFSINKTIELASISSTYELEKSNLRVQDLEMQNKRNASQRNALLIVAAGVMVLLIVLAFYFRRSIYLNKALKERENELKELNSMKDKLFSIIGHDLRGPISRIPEILEFYEDPATSESEKKFLLSSLKEHTKASIDMLEKLLFWGLSLVKGIAMREQQVSIKNVVEQNVAAKKLALEEKGISVTNKIANGLAGICDVTHFDFIIRNLLANAIKYSMPGGNIFLDSDLDSMPGFIVVSVKDSGTGISKELLPHIFSALRSVPGTKNEQGTGIGLMLCKEFAELNGGSIWAESEVGKGATFYFAAKAVK